jgi:GNAT superfamily N-acetyltransferase
MIAAQAPENSASLPAPGCEESVYISDHGLILRHGTSLSLMALVSTWLNDSSEFSHVDPSADWRKWSSRRPNFTLYYVALLDPARDGKDSIVACLRAVLDGVPVATPPHQPRLIVDYITTRPDYRGRGIAALLTNFVSEAARSSGANLYVLSLESSCVYWMGLGFVLCEDKNINARLNVFPDTHLLRRSSDSPDIGSEEDFVEFQAEQEEQADVDTSDDDSEDDEMEDEEAMQRAIALSLSQPCSAEAGQAKCSDAVVNSRRPARSDLEQQQLLQVSEEDTAEEEMRAAIALSLAD